MQSFSNVLIYDIQNNYQKHDRTHYETIIATWLLKNYLETDEADKIIKVLDQYYPQITSTEASNNSTVV
ncbi:hypothetical protein [Clostridium saccharoperbutylacetonicum]|uniref:hypothetical protein n=1 Tax=Clostridium saccharoperbutylacetonicum TaxID=36745 RepID=UPI0039E94301